MKNNKKQSKTLYNLEKGDIIISKYGYYRKILYVLDNILFVTGSSKTNSIDELLNSNNVYITTAQELKDFRFEYYKPKMVKVTKEEVAKYFRTDVENLIIE